MIRTLFHIALMTASVVVLVVSAAIAAILIVIAWPLWYIRRRRAREQRPQIALEVLNRRYALGEIDRTEYLQTRDDILVERRIAELQEAQEF